MEPNNIEQLVKTTFDDRHIEPSSNARERLVDALNSESKTKRAIWWRYAVAASIVLVLCMVGGKIFFEKNEATVPDQVVDEKEIPQIKSEEPVMTDEQSDLQLSLEENISKETPSVVPPKINTIASKTKTEKTVADQSEDHPKLMDVLKKETIGVESIAKIDSIKMSIPEQFMYVTPEDLLAATVGDSTPQLIQNTKRMSETYIESDQLLLETERQLFEEKNKHIFYRVGKQLKKIKESVANRNYKDSL